MTTEDNGRQCTKREMALLVTLFLAIFLTRLPWITAGYGKDPDAYRVIIAANRIAQTSNYHASRLPGYPVHEYLIAVTPAKTSPLFSNGLTAIFSSIASIFFALILRHFRIRQYLLLTLAFALTPVVYVNSTNTMDYMFSMAFTLGSTYFVLIHRPLVAGILLGLAIGSRITAGAMLLPLACWIFLEEKDQPLVKRFLIFIVAATTIGGICFLPVVHRYGIGFFTFSDVLEYPPIYSLIKKGVLGVWGVYATLCYLGLFCLVPFIFENIRKAIIQPHVRRGLVLSSLVVMLYVVAFLRLPIDSAYLIPVVPFVLLSIGLLIPPYLVRSFVIVMLLSAFITIGRSGVTLYGPILQDHWTRESRIEETKKITAAVARLSDDSIIVSAWKLPQIRHTLGGLHQNNHEYVYSIKDADTYRRYVEQGRRVYFLYGADVYNLEKHKVDLRQLGAQQLDALDKK